MKKFIEHTKSVLKSAVFENIVLWASLTNGTARKAITSYLEEIKE